MADAITFAPYLTWIDVLNPNEPPENAKLVQAADLLRYENFGVQASKLLNNHESRLLGAEGSISTLTSGLGTANTGITGINTRLNNASTGLDAKAPKANPVFTGNVGGITKAMVGLGNVDNTSDANKPVSTAQKTYIDAVGTRVTRLETDPSKGVYAAKSNIDIAFSNSETVVVSIPSVTFLAGHAYGIFSGIKNIGSQATQAGDVYVRMGSLGQGGVNGGDSQLGAATIWTHTAPNYGASDALSFVYLPTSDITRRVYLTGTRVVGNGTITFYSGASLIIKDFGSVL